MEFTSVGDVNAALTELAAAIERDTGRATALRETTERVHSRICAAWAGSQRDEASTAVACARSAGDAIALGLGRLHRCAHLLRDAAAQY